jgi:hypothetical protein
MADVCDAQELAGEEVSSANDDSTHRSDNNDDDTEMIITKNADEEDERRCRICFDEVRLWILSCGESRSNFTGINWAISTVSLHPMTAKYMC